MNESEYNALVEESWRRALTPEETARLDAWLVKHPEARAAWEAESDLNQLLGKLPDAPLASNFTARVMQELKRERVSPNRTPSAWRRIRQWLLTPGPRVAWALGLVAAIWIGYDQHRANVQEDVSTGLAVLAKVATLSDSTVLQDFDAISRFGEAAASEDEELFAVLTQ